MARQRHLQPIVLFVAFLLAFHISACQSCGEGNSSPLPIGTFTPEPVPSLSPSPDSLSPSPLPSDPPSPTPPQPQTLEPTQPSNDIPTPEASTPTPEDSTPTPSVTPTLTPPEPTQPPTPTTDTDGDGYPASSDCNDHEGSVHPGASEKCDGIDNDCDGASDEDFRADSDGDGTIDCLDVCPFDPSDDVDDDGLCAEQDNCPDVVNSSQVDLDGDGIGDACDACPADAFNDVDQDTVCGDVDNCPSLANQDQKDGDHNGVGDACALELCDGLDNDGDDTIDEGFSDADEDGKADCVDRCQNDPNNDSDGDGVCGDVDNCSITANPGQEDVDHDGRGDTCDLCSKDPDNDADRDGVCGDVDNCPSLANANQGDVDLDGNGDACDACVYDISNDADRDGICGDVDNCPTIVNAAQSDADHDGSGDACDPCPTDSVNDVDKDGVCSDMDNCPSMANADQKDADFDGNGDACDLCPSDSNDDIDKDGVCGDVDNCISTSNASQVDADRDGSGDACDPCPNDGSNDGDEDGVCGDLDNCPSIANSSQIDNDRDGKGDACDACPNDADNDLDNDGVCGDADNCPAITNTNQSDNDQDAVGDICDACSSDPKNDLDHDGVCGDVDKCPTVADSSQIDRDGDGQGDACDPCPIDNPNDVNGDGVCGDDLPPDPEWVAPASDPTVPTSFSGSTEFLYTGSDPIQTGVTSGTIKPDRSAVLRGRVVDADNFPLPGVTLTILNHPEIGSTLSRADGWFDLVVNGGGWLVVDYQLKDFMPAQRQYNVPLLDYVTLTEVTLLQPSDKVTEIVPGAANLQVARGLVEVDTDGARQATVLFPALTTATMVMADGTTQPLSEMHVRATEFTVGETGPQSMPAGLPPGIAYTYCVDLSVDEAVAAGAKSVNFSQPVPYYVENFLGFPVGEPVPSGYYDRVKGVWVPSTSGVVLEVLSVTDGLADLDTDGDHLPETPSRLSALGVSEEEQAHLASLYAPGQSLWRVPVDHFSYWDFNWGEEPDCSDGEDCDCDRDGASCDPGDSPTPRPCDEGSDGPYNPNDSTGSEVHCPSQTLGQSAAVIGTGLSLHYSSDRVPGRKTHYTLDIPLGGPTLPSTLQSIDVTIDIAGKHFERSFAPIPDQVYQFTWDGRDVYGRTLQGQQPVTVRVGYSYKRIYTSTGRFGYMGNGKLITGEPPPDSRGKWDRLDYDRQSVGGSCWHVDRVRGKVGRLDGERAPYL